MFFFFFNDTATTEIYTLSLHDALPICLFRPLPRRRSAAPGRQDDSRAVGAQGRRAQRDRGRSEEHTSELQSRNISYAVFCLKKKTILTVQMNTFRSILSRNVVRHRTVV